MKTTLAVLLLSVTAFISVGSAEKKRPQGEGENETVAIYASVVAPEELDQEFHTTFHNSFTVLEVRVKPKGDKPVEVSLDDFILRSESDGDHSGALAAAQVVDGGALVIRQTFSDRTNAQSAPMIAGTKVEMKDDLNKGVTGTPEFLAGLKKRILGEGSITEQETGLLFFPLEKKKARSLVLSYAAPGGKLRIQFK
jgi:hypothetical protein